VFLRHQTRTLNIIYLPTDMSHMKECMTNIAVAKQEHSRPTLSQEPKCFRNYFKDVLLVIVYHFAKYDSIPHLESLYKGAFPNIAICGPKEDKEYKVDIIVKNDGGLIAYHCLGRAVRLYPRYEGYLYINDDMIVNWWNFRNFDKSKIWQSSFIENGHPLRQEGDQNISYSTKWVWFNSSYGVEPCNKTIKEIRSLKPYNWDPNRLIANLKHNGDGRMYCSKGWSDVYYIPRIYADQFADICDIFYRNKVFLEIAVTTMIRLLDLRENTVKLSGHYLPDIGPSDSKSFWTHYRTDITFMHPFKFHVKSFAEMNVALLKNWVIKYSAKYLEC